MQFRENLCKNTIFFSTILLIFLIILPSLLNGSEIGNPYIQQIAIKNFGINNNNFFALKDKNGILYVKNSNGILRYNGNSWELFKQKNNFQFTLADDGYIYIGADNKFGFIKTDQNQYKFVSLLDSNQLYQLGEIKQLISHNNSVLFTCSDKLYKWKDNELKLLSEFNNEIELFKVGNNVYLENQEVGIQELKADNLITIPNSDFFKNKNIVCILPYNEQLLIKTKQDRGFFLFDNHTIAKFKTNADDHIYAGKFVHACQLNNGNYAIATEQKGIIIINKKGETVSFINENSGLYNLSSNFLLADQANNLWALHDHGISRIEFPSPYRYFNKTLGLRGKVNAVTRFKNTLYVATSQGLFYLQEHKHSPSRFYAIKNINANCFKFHERNNQLFVLCNKGIYKIEKKYVASVFYNRNAEEITCVWNSKQNPETLFLGNSKGFTSIRFTNEIFIINDKSEQIKSKVNYIAEDKNGYLWLVTDNNKLWRINPTDNFTDAVDFSNKINLTGDLDWIILNPIQNDILFTTSNGVFQFDHETQTFISETIIGLNHKIKNHWVYTIVEDAKQNFWINILSKDDSKNTTLVKFYEQNKFESFHPLPLSRVKDFYVTSILPDKNNMIWFGGIDGLVRLDLSQLETKGSDPKIVLNKIVLNSDSIIYKIPFGYNYDKQFALNEILFNLNTISFDYSANNYASEDQILYQYRLIGYDSIWSKWSPQNKKEYTNLYEGKYSFQVKAKTITNEISNTATYNFTIKPPIYRSLIAFLLYLVILSLLFILISKWRAYYFARERFRLENIIHERTEEVVIQKEKADNLLERVLPKNTAKELKSGRKAGPYHYNMVTVLFSDIQGFTKISEQMESELLIDELDRFFLQFDTVVEKYNIEKIKTIGDAYMCAGGIPTKNRTNPVEVVLAAVEMQNFMKELKSKADESTKHIWDLRIGIDTGPVIAGVLGKSKISYDIWGGTVNTASRMEASSESGKINVTENTYMLIKDFFICRYRGKMPVKYKGEIDMYFVEGFQPELASDKKRQIPNDNFFTQLQLLRVNDVEEFVLSKLEDGLPDNLYYHNVKHTIDVVTQVELIGRSEGVSDNDILILKTAALFHDMGHLVNYDTHEEESIKLAKKILPEYNYTNSQVEQVCRLIQVTQMPPQPKNLLEEIMCDADLDYLGRTDFVPVSISLYKELAERNKIDSILEWNKMQLKFIKNHHYFTKTAQNLREVNKKKQLENIQAEIKRELAQHDE